jgi:hypothetical protein
MELFGGLCCGASRYGPASVQNSRSVSRDRPGHALNVMDQRYPQFTCRASCISHLTSLFSCPSKQPYKSTMPAEPAKQSALQSLRNWGGTITCTLQTLSNAFSRAICDGAFWHCTYNGQKTPSRQPSLQLSSQPSMRVLSSPFPCSFRQSSCSRRTLT